VKSGGEDPGGMQVPGVSRRAGRPVESNPGLQLGRLKSYH
jgi:hypothetical protein